MTRLTLAVSILPAVLGAAGCFDAHSVDQGPWVIDDFEDGDLKPADPSFGPWIRYTFSPPNQSSSAGLDAGDQSLLSLALDFTIVDPADGVNQYGGAGVQTGTAATPESFSHFSEMVFGSKVVSGVPGLSSMAWASVELGCSTALLDDGTTPGNLFVAQTFAITVDWKPQTLPMANFGPPFDSTHILGGPAACLQRIDAIRFNVHAELADGQSATARLNVDGIAFQ